MKNALISFGKIILSLILGAILTLTHAATIQSNNIYWNLFFVVLFTWGIGQILWKKPKKRKKYKKFKINPDTWKKDFEKILQEEKFSKKQIPKVLQFAQNFQGFEKRKFENIKKTGFKGSIGDYESNWERVFADRMDMGILAVKMRPKTLGFLASLRNKIS